AIMNDGVVLLIEDNDDDVELTLRSFNKQNIANPIVVARDGREALNYLFAQGPHAGRDARQRPVLILLDLKLPLVDGITVLRQIRSSELTKLIPVVILTSSGEVKVKINSYNLGPNSYIRKPVDFDQFLEATRQLSC